jgi:hypothetical protein
MKTSALVVLCLSSLFLLSVLLPSPSKDAWDICKEGENLNNCLLANH